MSCKEGRDCRKSPRMHGQLPAEAQDEQPFMDTRRGQGRPGRQGYTLFNFLVMEVANGSTMHKTACAYCKDNVSATNVARHDANSSPPHVLEPSGERSIQPIVHLNVKRPHI